MALKPISKPLSFVKDFSMFVQIAHEAVGMKIIAMRLLLSKTL